MRRAILLIRFDVSYPSQCQIKFTGTYGDGILTLPIGGEVTNFDPMKLPQLEYIQGQYSDYFIVRLPLKKIDLAKKYPSLASLPCKFIFRIPDLRAASSLIAQIVKLVKGKKTLQNEILKTLESAATKCVEEIENDKKIRRLARVAALPTHHANLVKWQQWHRYKGFFRTSEHTARNCQLKFAGDTIYIINREILAREHYKFEPIRKKTQSVEYSP